jgi:hypothetical protein
MQRLERLLYGDGCEAFHRDRVECGHRIVVGEAAVKRAIASQTRALSAPDGHESSGAGKAMLN